MAMRLCTVLACITAGAALSADGGSKAQWTDFESRIQYAYYTEDLRALVNLAALLSAREASDPWANYYAAFANYRYLSLAAAPRNDAGTAAEKCADAAEHAAPAKETAVEAETLQAGCLDALGQLKPVRAALATPRAKKRLAHALGVAPNNPRALLLNAAGRQAPEAEKLLLKAIQRFEVERRSETQGPTWGEADAYLALGRIRFARGEVLASRDALERALLLAPEFAAARKLLSEITSH